MDLLGTLKPRAKPRIIDLVEAAGLDVSAWGDRPSGRPASTNPKYCYNWCFTQPGKPSVVSLWHDTMAPSGRTISYDVDFSKYGASADGVQGALWRKRAAELENVVAETFTTGASLKVIICGRHKPLRPDRTKVASKTVARALDDVCWNVEHYDPARRTCRLLRSY